MTFNLARSLTAQSGGISKGVEGAAVGRASRQKAAVGGSQILAHFNFVKSPDVEWFLTWYQPTWSFITSLVITGPILYPIPTSGTHILAAECAVWPLKVSWQDGWNRTEHGRAGGMADERGDTHYGWLAPDATPGRLTGNWEAYGVVRKKYFPLSLPSHSITIPTPSQPGAPSILVHLHANAMENLRTGLLDQYTTTSWSCYAFFSQTVSFCYWQNMVLSTVVRFP